MKSFYTTSAILFALLIPALFSAQTPDTFQITGCAKYWANDHPVKNVQMYIHLGSTGGTTQSFTGMASPDSLCSTAAVVADPGQPNIWFSVTGEKLDGINDYRNGLSVGDLICIQKHILGLAPLATYGLMAADANQSRSVTTYDLAELRKLLFGIYDELPNSPSWQVWSPNCSFPTPAGPFNENLCPGFPVASLPDYESNPIDIAAIKIGDVNGDYDFDGNYLPGGALDSQHLQMPEIAFKAGEILDVPLYWKTPLATGGIQFALQYDTAVLEFKEFLPNTWSHLSEWVVFPDKGSLKYITNFIDYSTADTLAKLRFLAKASGKLTETIFLDTSSLRPLYYDDCGLSGKIQLGFDATSKAGDLAAIVQALSTNPNPFSEKCTVSLSLERPAMVRVEVRDLAGRLTYSTSYELSPGEHQLDIPAGAVLAGGLAFYRLTIGPDIFAGKIIRL